MNLFSVYMLLAPIIFCTSLFACESPMAISKKLDPAIEAIIKNEEKEAIRNAYSPYPGSITSSEDTSADQYLLPQATTRRCALRFSFERFGCHSYRHE